MNLIRRMLPSRSGRSEGRHERHDVQPRSGDLLACRGLEVAYGSMQVLFGVDLAVREGEILALLGTNGAGKSTLLKAICGSVPVAKGTVLVGDEDVTGRSAAASAAAGVVLTPGGKGVFPGLTVAENMQLATWLNEKRDRGEHAWERPLQFFPVLRERWTQKAGTLSGGQQQMLTVAMALVGKPRLMMIDELSLGLAPVVIEQLLGVVREINATGVTVILVEQSVNLALTLASRAVFMEKGEVRFDGPTAKLLDQPSLLRSVFLDGAARPAKEPVKPPSSGAPRRQYSPPVDRTGRVRAPVLSVRDVAVSFGGIRAVNGVSFDVHQAEILGVIGPNGAGKTTLLNLISGFVPASKGMVSLKGVDVTRFSPDARARLGLGRSFQDARLFPSLTTYETIALARERHVKTRDPVAAALGSPATRESERRVRADVEKLIELLRLEALANKFVSELSTGSRRMVDLACVLAHEPSVLLLDEPSSGIAQRETEALAPVLMNIRDDTDTALVVIEHDMPLIQAVSDLLLALELGQPVMLDEPEVVLHDPRVIAGYLGTTPDVIQRSGERVRRRRGARRASKPLSVG